MIIQDIEKILKTAIQKSCYENEELFVSFSALPKICDFQFNGCFLIAKRYKSKPNDIAINIVKNIEKDEFFIFNVCPPGYINISLTNKAYDYYANLFLKDDRLGINKKEKSEKVLLDYGGANIAKALHVGHLRSPIIGESLKRLYKFMGDEVISDVHLGDWGLQMGLTELQLFEDGVLNYYFTGEGEEPKLTLEMLNDAYPKASLRKNIDINFKNKADEWTLKIQEKKEPYFTIYEKIKKVSVEKIKRHYKELGAEFDLWLGESDCYNYIPIVLDIIKNKGLSKENDGTVTVDVAIEGENIPIPKKEPDEQQRYKNPMPPAILKKYNGGVLYATTDIATIYMRNKMYDNLDRIEYIVDLRQSLHFTQVFRVCKMSEISPINQKLIHIGYGTMNGKDGKPFKTRSGESIKLEDIIDLLINKAKDKLKANGVTYDNDLALKIGVGAMKFGDLSNNVSKDYVFDIEKFMSFEGKTGPYIQYTVCRINSILEKVINSQQKIKIFSQEEKEIMKAIFKLQQAYEQSYKEKTLNSLCLATYDLASAFSTFYNIHKIVTEENEEKKQSLISLIVLVKKQLIQALNILAIEIPEKM